MSLVHDALEKAKREAAAKNAREIGLPEPATAQPFRARRSAHSLGAVAAGASLLVALAAAVLYFVREDSPRPETAARRVTSVPTAPAPAPAAAAPAPTVPPAASAGGAASAMAPSSAVPSVAEPPSPVASALPAAARSAPTATTPSPVVARATAAPAAAAAASTFMPSFRRQVTLDDGTVVKLGGIAWSEAAPLAYLNGKLYGPRESVAGLRVEAIEKERVLLARADGGKLYLTLR